MAFFPVVTPTGPIFNLDWSVPWAQTWYRDWSQNLQETTLRNTTQYVFREPQFTKHYTLSPGLTWIQRFELSIPFNQQDWPVPKGYLRSNDYTWIESGNSILPQPTPFLPLDQSLPPRASLRLQDYTWIEFGNNLLPFPTPFVPVDQPNPKSVSWYRSIEFSGNALTAVTNNPFFQTDWPLSRTYQPIDQFWINNLQLLPKPTPFFQNVDFPLPVVTQPIDPTWLQNLSEFLQANTFPFVQSDYPNPRTYVPIDQFWLQNLINLVTQTNPIPFNEFDWPLPKTYLPIDQYWFQALVLNLPIPPPPVQQDLGGKTWTREEWTKKLTQYVQQRQRLLTFSEMGKMGGRPRKYT